MTEKKKKTWKKVTLSIVLALLVLIGWAFLYVNHLYNKSLAQIEGTIQMEGLDGEVVVTTDEDGVPHIEAESDRDLYMVLGYVKVQHRLLQNELSLSKESGQLNYMMLDAVIGLD